MMMMSSIKSLVSFYMEPLYVHFVQRQGDFGHFGHSDIAVLAASAASRISINKKFDQLIIIAEFWPTVLLTVPTSTAIILLVHRLPESIIMKEDTQMLCNKN
jgi:hypothetical protein